MKNPASLALQQFLLEELAEVRRWRKAVLKDTEPEHVHQLRVNLRKSRSILKLCSPILKPGYRRRWQHRLRLLAKQLDAARDLDVFIQDHHIEIDADTSLKRALERKRERTYKKLRSRLRHGRFKPWRRQFNKQLLRVDWAQRHCHQQALSLKHLAEQRLEKIHTIITKQVERLDINNDKALHQLRIAFKQLRYSCEFLTPVLNKKQHQTYLDNIKLIQDLLGSLHDVSVQQSRFAELPDAVHIDIDVDGELRQEIEARLVGFIGLGKPWRSI